VLSSGTHVLHGVEVDPEGDLGNGVEGVPEHQVLDVEHALALGRLHLDRVHLTAHDGNTTIMGCRVRDREECRGGGRRGRGCWAVATHQGVGVGESA
jgi:hypothetical protein